MTTKKSIQIVEMLLERKTNLKADLSKPKNNWGDGIVGEFIECELESLTNEIKMLNLLKNEISPQCEHLTEMHDTCKGQKYCMNCNMDL